MTVATIKLKSKFSWLSNKLKGYGVETEKTRDANVYITNELEELFKRYLQPDTDS
mgnify:CR=1 FL=1